MPPSNLYVHNHSYQVARALLAYVERASMENDEELLAAVRPVIERLAQILALEPPLKPMRGGI